MIFSFLFLFLALYSDSLAQGQNDEPIDQCVKGVVKTGNGDGNGQQKNRPSIDPRSCRDLDTGSCTLFALAQQESYRTNFNNDP